MRHTMRSLLHLLLAAAVAGLSSATDDHEHAQALKDFVPDHPHLHELVDLTHKHGDLDAKHRFERESLSIRFNKTKSRLPPDTDQEHVVLHFLDDYSAHVSGGATEHKFMQLEPFIKLLDQHDDLKLKLAELAQMLERAECDFNCLGDNLTHILNESINRLMARQEL